MAIVTSILVRIKMSTRVLVIGATNIDLLIQSKTPYQLYDSNIASSHISLGGVGANVAMNLAHLRHSVSFITAFSSDDFGTHMKDQLEHLDIDVSNAVEVTDSRSNLYIAVMDQRNDLYLGINDMPLTNHITVDSLATKQDYISSFDTIVLDNNLSEDVLHFLLETYSNKFIAIDAVSGVKLPKIIPYLQHINVLKVNELEYQLLLQIVDVQSMLDMSECTILHSNHDQPVRLYKGNQSISEESIPCTNIVSTSGAGDALFSGYLSGILYGKDESSALQKGIDLAYKTLQVLSSTITR